MPPRMAGFLRWATLDASDGLLSGTTYSSRGVDVLSVSRVGRCQSNIILITFDILDECSEATAFEAGDFLIQLSLMNIELRHLRYFLAVAEDLHFGKAANRLGISQPPLSQQILALEREIGARLFERSNRRVELTNAGKIFLKQAAEIIARVDSAAALAERVHRGQLGELKIGFFGSAPFVDEFQRLLFDFRKEHPNVNLVLQAATTSSSMSFGRTRIPPISARPISTASASSRLAREWRTRIRLPSLRSRTSTPWRPASNPS